MIKFIILFTILFSLSALPIKKPNKSALENIAEKFQILSGVTNAVYLEAATIQNTVSDREIIAEILKVSPENFEGIFQINTTETISLLRILSEKTEKVMTNRTELTLYVESFRKSVEDLIESVRFSVEWNLGIIGEQVLKGVSELKGISGWRKNCSIVSLSDAGQLSRQYDILNDEKSHSETSYKSQLDNFLECYEQFIGCLSSISDLEGFLQNQVVSVSQPIAKFLKVKKDIVKFLMSLQELKKNTKFFEGYLNGILNDVEENVPLDYKLGEDLAQTYQSHADHSDSFGTPFPINTLAFANYSDMRKVFNSLKNPWFEQFVSRGYDVAKLNQSLITFREMARTMDSLIVEWKSISHLDDVSQTILEPVANYTHSIYKFSRVAKKPPGGNFLGHLGQALSECVKEYEDYTSIVKNLKQLDTMPFLKNDLDSVHEISRKLLISGTVPKYLGCLNRSISTVPADFSNSHSTEDDAKEVLRSMQKEYHSFDFGQLHEIEEDLSNLVNFPNKSSVDFTIEYLKQVAEVKSSIKTVEKQLQRAKHDAKFVKKNPVLSMQNSKHLSENLARCTQVLMRMVAVAKNSSILQTLGDSLDDYVLDIIDEKHEMRNIKKKALVLSNFYDLIDKKARSLQGLEVREMSAIFKEFLGIYGIRVPREELWKLRNLHKNDSHFQNASKDLDILINLDLDFSKDYRHLKSGQDTVNAVMDYFGVLFGYIQPFKKTEEENDTKFYVVLGIIIFIGGSCFFFHFCADFKREAYWNTFLFYFGKPHHYEKRWRYSMFLDNRKGSNRLFRAIVRGDLERTIVKLKRGAYIDAHNECGDTPLHVAVKECLPEFVEILIKFGADRTLLNSRNFTAEQYISIHSHDEFTSLQKIFEKFRKKKFRKRIPPIFPNNNFNVWISDGIPSETDVEFKRIMQNIPYSKPYPTPTHCVVKVDDDGILETDNLDLLILIFNGSIIVSEAWLSACIQNKKFIDRDFKFLVKRVKFKGVVYGSVLRWFEAMAKAEMPYLYGVHANVSVNEPNKEKLESLIFRHGGVVLKEIPVKSGYRVGSHPYLHVNLGPLFIIHDGKTDLKTYENDPDKMYTLFTKDEFLVFMLQRNINRDGRDWILPVDVDEI